jgi:predicted helicase
MQSFNDIYILNLHGSSKKKETAPDGSKDENVFDIQQGVCIGIFVKQPGSNRKCQIHYADLWGDRQSKYDKLDKLDLGKTKWTKVDPESPQFLFIPQDKDSLCEYQKGWGLTDILKTNVLGFQSHRDPVAIAFEKEKLFQQVSDFLLTQLMDDEFKLHVSLCSYRPFDSRYGFFRKDVCDRPRTEILKHIFRKDNLCLNSVRQTKMTDWKHILVSKNPAPAVYIELKDGSNIFPLYLYSDSEEFNFGEATRKPNLSDKFIKEFNKKLGLKFVADGQGDLKKTFGPEDVFYYIYAILHSPTYRTRYADFLKIDFPRVPLTSDKKLFATLVKLGGELSALHLMESPELNKTSVAFPVAGNSEVEKGFPKFNVDATPSSRSAYEGKRDEGVASTSGRVYINATQYFDGVPSEVWNFTIGGYQVCEKWLKDRRERQLTHDDLQHYKKIVAALSRTVELMQEIDATIPVWPIQ